MKLPVTKELYSLKYTDIPVLGNRFQEGRIEDIRKQCTKQGKVISSTFNTKQTKQQQTSQHCKKCFNLQDIPQGIQAVSQISFPFSKLISLKLDAAPKTSRFLRVQHDAYKTWQCECKLAVLYVRIEHGPVEESYRQ